MERDDMVVFIHSFSSFFSSMAPIPSKEMDAISHVILSSSCLSSLPRLLQSASSRCARLYVSIDSSIPFQSTLQSVYKQASTHSPSLDVRVLLKRPRDGIPSLEPCDISPFTPPLSPEFTRVCLGGTFDRLHNGHKVLLSRAAMLTKDAIVCGVTTGQMIRKKTLWEMIEPVQERMLAVQEFVSDIANVTCEMYPIEDPFGPSITMHDLEAIVVSAETVKGGAAVNTKRQERGMSLLKMVEIELIEGEDSLLNETKLSSSSRRREALGTLLRPVNHIARFKQYTIGLTGGIAAGKSNVAKDLREMGYEVIDCDQVAHDCYAPGSPLIARIESAFPGTTKNGEVNRKALGDIVFSNKDKRLMLNSLVWPAVLDAVNRKVSEAPPSSVVFIEAAALVEAGWQGELNEIWTVFCGREEELNRVVKRDKMTYQQAEARLSSQIDNCARLAISNVAICSDWERSITQSQVTKAVQLMEKRRNDK